MEVITQTYRKLTEIRILHDYFNTASPDYNIGTELNILPTRGCESLLKDYQIVFKHTRTGFILLIKAESIPMTSSFRPFIRFENSLKFSFLISLKNPYLINYTNLRLIDHSSHLYHFDNLDANLVGGVAYLSQELPPYGTPYPGDTAYHLGDLIVNGTVHSANTSIPIPTATLDSTLWTDLGNSGQYVSAQDRIRLQGPLFGFEAANTHPGELVEFTLTDQFGVVQPLGLTRFLDQPAGTVQAPLNPDEPIRHQIDLTNFLWGRYTMTITRYGAGSSESFLYYIVDTREGAIPFGIVELWVNPSVPTGYRLVSDLIIPSGTFQVLNGPDFQINFNSRSTIWRYLNQDDTLEVETPTPRKLTQRYSGFNLAGNPLPDAGVKKLVVVRNGLNPDLIDNIISEIYI